MSEKINIDELKAMIANEIRSEGFNEILDSMNIEEIANNILLKQRMDSQKSEIPDIIPEQVDASSSMTQTPESSVPSDMPSSNKEDSVNSFGTGTTNSQTSVDRSTTGNIPSYTPELPSFLDKIEPGKVIVFDMNELSHGGENLSHIPFRTFENPDIKKSMNQLWIEDGKRKTEVWIAKFEKIGDIEFNYANGTSQFIEKRFDPDFAVQAKYKENPYGASSTPQENNIDSQNIMAQISTAVDLENVVKGIVMDLIKKGVSDASMSESTPGYAAYKALRGDGDALNPSSFDVNMSKLVDDNVFTKTDLPDELKEHIDSGSRDFLKNENQEVEEWEVGGMKYYLPKNRISKNKGYIKK